MKTLPSSLKPLSRCPSPAAWSSVSHNTPHSLPGWHLVWPCAWRCCSSLGSWPLRCSQQRVLRSPIPPCGMTLLNCPRVKVPWRALATNKNLQSLAPHSPPRLQHQRTAPLQQEWTRMEDHLGQAPLQPS
ncbi:LOC363276 (predicted), isoform CRA_a [Rattus norvegicus]|uniref:LOC363276 (Predicted), isoform CRA_a n=1 Tax=Rattus norvegicus TaxID=10116 RepID=A6JWN1_RAT|nr:LOC363276 (predicted), isoform CRA_a [Rattus norvegicus]|eukprot:NP_001128059.1 uncharacterized protein C2orf82 homolog [Rattus norvegicus]